MRKEPTEEAKRWLDQASEDLMWSRDLAKRGGYHIACFLAQQVVGRRQAPLLQEIFFRQLGRYEVDYERIYY